MTSTDVAFFLRDKAVPLWKRGLGILAALYVASPLDLIPDWIPVIGWLDDLGVLALCSWYFIREVRKHAAARASLPPSNPSRP